MNFDFRLDNLEKDIKKVQYFSVNFFLLLNLHELYFYLYFSTEASAEDVFDNMYNILIKEFDECLPYKYTTKKYDGFYLTEKLEKMKNNLDAGCTVRSSGENKEGRRLSGIQAA